MPLEYPCDVDRWKGKIVFTNDYLSFPALVSWEKALSAATKLKESTDSLYEFYAALLPNAIPLVGKWEIAGLPEHVTYEDFPASPRLVAWLVETITDLYEKTNASDPNSQGG